MTRALAKTLPPLPARWAHLPIGDNGFPVPWFVHIDPATGIADFRVIGRGKLHQAVTGNRCWICGGSLGRHQVFCIGPMCAINRVSSEPPSHRECAEFAAAACPFLSQPRARRNDKAPKPEGTRPQPGLPAERNPGGVLLWESRNWHPFRVGDGHLIDVGEPVRVDWWVNGKPASRGEAEAIFYAGAEFLRGTAPDDISEAERTAGLLELARQVDAARQFLPIDGGTWAAGMVAQ